MVIGQQFLTAVKADLSFPGPNCEIFGGNPITVVHETDVPPNSEMVLPCPAQHPIVRNEQGIYCKLASTALVMVKAGMNLPDQTWWLKVMNPQEEAMHISQGGVQAYGTEA